MGDLLLLESHSVNAIGQSNKSSISYPIKITATDLQIRDRQPSGYCERKQSDWELVIGESEY